MSQKGFAPIIILGILVILGLVGGGFLYYQKQCGSIDRFDRFKNNQSADPCSGTGSITVTDVQRTTNYQNNDLTVTAVNGTPVISQTANWKAYTDTKIGYSIQYPANWSAKEGVFATSGTPDYGYNNDVYVSIREKKYSYHDNTKPVENSLDSYIKYIEKGDVSTIPSRIPESITKITTKYGINGYLIEWKKTSGQFGPTAIFYSTFFALPNDATSVLQIETNKNHNQTEIYNLMVSTFKFTQ